MPSSIPGKPNHMLSERMALEAWRDARRKGRRLQEWEEGMMEQWMC